MLNSFFWTQPVFSRNLLCIVWREAFDEGPEVRLEAVGEVVNDGHLGEGGDIDPFLNQKNIIWNVFDSDFLHNVYNSIALIATK